jgi:alkanesulfonate monooxygenase SsuD/methylene tetrahydromethanopterin reductase-like flavin-dependent oxidoreductase (luciferase family)
MQFGEETLSLQRLVAAVDAARDCGFAAVSANDHLVFQTPWLDGPTALASIIERSGEMGLATTVSLATLRGPGSVGQDAGRDRRPLRRSTRRRLGPGIL